MAIAITLEEFFAKENVNYEVIKHRPTATALDSSVSAKLPPEQVAKAVILEDSDGGFLMASVPAKYLIKSLLQAIKLSGINRLIS